MDSNDSGKKKIVLVLVILTLSLATGVGLGLAPPAKKNWIMTTLMAIVMPIVTIRFVAASIMSWRKSNRMLGFLWGILAIMFLLFTIAAWQYFSELPPWPGFR